jgi:hypothetical protein
VGVALLFWSLAHVAGQGDRLPDLPNHLPNLL